MQQKLEKFKAKVKRILSFDAVPCPRFNSGNIVLQNCLR